MLKKLLISPFVVLFLMSTFSMAKANDGALAKDNHVVKAPEKQVFTNPKAVVNGPEIDRVATKKSAIPADNFADPEGDVVRANVDRSHKKPALIRKRGYLYPGDPTIYPLNNRDGNPHGYLFNYDDESTEYYLSGGTAGDEWGIWFQSPQAACSLYAVELTFYAPEGGGTINLDVMSAGSVTPDTVMNEDSIAVDNVFGANLMGDYFPLEIQALSDWEQFVFPDWGYDIDVGRDIFWIHWEKTGDAPMLLADDQVPGDYLRTWTYEPNQDGDEKWSHYGYSVGIEAMVRAEVIFYEDPPPTVQAVQMNDTYRTDAVTLTANAYDNALDPDLEGIASGSLIYSLNGAAFDTMAATVTGDTATGFTVSATIDAGSAGDVVDYYFHVTDLAGLESRSFPTSTFSRLAPTYPDADVLVVRDGVSSAQRDLLERVLNDNNFVYELWDVDDHHGIDASVVGFGWDNILVYGWGSTSVPMFATDADPGYADFIDGGGNLFLTDMDWMCASSAGCGDATFTWEAGDFAYDYFGLASGENDPGTIEIVPITGQNVTQFDGMELELDHAAYLLTADAGWIDYITPGDATPIFVDDGSNVVGASMDHSGSGGGIAVYLSFMADAAGDTLETGDDWDYSQFADLVDGVIDYFNIVSPPVVSINGTQSTMYGVASGTNSATVTSKVIDGDGTLASVTAKWTVDDGTVNSAAMSSTSGDLYSATFDLTGFTDTSTVEYWVEATDNDGLTTMSGAGSFWGTDFTPTSGVNVLYMLDAYAPYAAYGSAKGDSTVRANLDAISATYDTWNVWNEYQADYGTILSNYTHVIYNGILDWVMMPKESDKHPLTAFVQNGGVLLYTSEEVLGTYTDWTDGTFSPGHFVYDVLGVEWVGNDYNYLEVAANEDAAGLIEGMSTDDIAFADTTDLGSMADICDPLGYGTPDQLTSPFLADYTGADNYYYASSKNGNTYFLAFCTFMLPTDQQQTLYENFLGIVGVDEEVTPNVPEAFTLKQNYPNPFNPATTINYTLPKAADVNLTVYNILGKEVATLVNTNQNAGIYSVKWDASNLASGMYFYKIKAGDFTKTHKMILLK